MPKQSSAGARAGLAALLVAFSVIATAQQPFDAMLADLRSPREGTRIKALRTVVQSGYPQVLAAIAPLVLDSSNSVQLEAIDSPLTVCLAPAPDPKRAHAYKAE